MNYNWEKIVEKGQYENGFIDVYKTFHKKNKAFVIINYLVEFGDNDRKINTTILLEGEKINWTEGDVKDILYDCEERVKNIADFKFKVFSDLEYMTIQTFYIPTIDNLEFGTNGDFSFEK